MRYFVAFVTMMVVVGFYSLSLFTPVNADDQQSSNWIQGQPTVQKIPAAEAPSGGQSQECHNEEVSIGNITGETAMVCVYQADGWRYGMYGKYIATSNWTGYTIKGFVFGFNGDKAMYKVRGTNIFQPPIYVPGSNDLVYRYADNSPWGSYMTVIKDFPKQLQRVVGTLATTEYELPDSATKYLIQDTAGDYVSTRSVGLSKNGDWMVVELRPGGLLRINTKTYEKRIISTFAPTYGVGLDATLEFAVSNDGEQIAVTGQNAPSLLFTVSDDCGRDVTVFEKNMATYGSVTSCPSRELRTPVVSALGKDFNFMSNPSFNYDGNELTALVTRQNPDPFQDWVAIRAAGYTPSKITYMGLGDSYTSGEGDIGKKADGTSYYKPLTDIWPNSCHLSERSYPYLLQKHFDLPQHNAASIACSGARMHADYYAPLDVYQGQAARMKDLSAADRERAKVRALDAFIPGRVPQLEFVKKYQPSVITLMGGGNDVGFSGILGYCASFAWQDYVPGVNADCDYAKPNTELRRILGQSIQDQYAVTKRTIEKIKDASPNTKVYIVGYPSFIAGSDATCALNSGFLSGDERDMINQSVSYLNDVLQKAADTSGAHYLDIEDSLNGGRLCEGSEYVTGVKDKNFGVLGESLQEAFHPNALAHFKIAQTIVNEGFSLLRQVKESMSDNGPPEIPQYFGITNSFLVRNEPFIENDTIKQGDVIELKLRNGLAGGGTAVEVGAYSSHVLLLNTNTKGDGTLDQKLVLPESLTPGIHVFVINTISPSGEPSTYFQQIEIQSRLENDIDGDGVSDNIDPCNFIAHWYNEATGNDECLPRVENQTGVTDPDRIVNMSTVSKGAQLLSTSTEQSVTGIGSGAANELLANQQKQVSSLPRVGKQKAGSLGVLIISSGFGSVLIVVAWGVYVKVKRRKNE